MTRRIGGTGRRSPALRWRRLAGFLVFGPLMCASAGAAPERLAGWHALVIGVDGAEPSTAARDATALADALKRRGVSDTTLLTDSRATRSAVIESLRHLADRTKPGELVVLAFDGTGLRDDDPAPDTLALTLLLAGGKATPPADRRFSGAELTAVIRAIEARAGRVVLIADAATGGRMPRRMVPAPDGARREASADGGLAGATASPLFDRSLVIAAADLRFGSGSVPLPGTAHPGRILTFAIARALDGDVARAGDPHLDGALVSYAARLVYQLSDQRQQVVALFGRAARDGAAPAALTRGIVIKSTAALMDPPTRAPGDPSAPEAPSTLFPHAGESGLTEPIRIAPASGSRDQLEKLLPPTPQVQAVTRNESPDLIWDPTFKNVLTPEGDLVADDIDSAAIPRIIDRALAIRQLKAMIVDAPQAMVLMPDDEVKQTGNIVKVVVKEAAGRSLILFDIRCDGKVRLLYPRLNDPPIIADATFELPLRVSDPVGTDTVVAVTGTQRLTDLEQQLAKIIDQKAPVAAIRLIHDAALPGTLVGAVSIFSTRP